MIKKSEEAALSQDVIEKVRDALGSRGLTLVGSIGRVIILLPERGRVNVMAQDDSGTEYAVTIFQDEDGSLKVRTAEEFNNVRIFDTGSSSVKDDSSPVAPKQGRIGKRTR